VNKAGKTETKPEESFLINDTIWVFSLQTGAPYCFTNSDVKMTCHVKVYAAITVTSSVYKHFSVQLILNKNVLKLVSCKKKSLTTQKYILEM